jgi:hypothetical protein
MEHPRWTTTKPSDCLCTTAPKRDAIVAELWPAGPPRLFALIQETDDEDGQVAPTVTAYGIALPDGPATTVGAAGTGWGLWLSADSACRRTGSDLLWLSG